MGTLVLKYVAILSLMARAAFKRTSGYLLLLAFLICVSAVAVGAQAMRAKKYVLSAVFFAIAVFFNPFFPILASEPSYLGVLAACIGAFVLSLFVLKNIPEKTIASITERSSSDSL